MGVGFGVRSPTRAGPMDGESAAVLAAARQVGLSIASEDLAGVTAHLRLLLGFAAVVGDPTPEPAPVYRP